MPKFGEDSKRELATLDWRLQFVLSIAIKLFDFKILNGHRSVAKQKELFSRGRDADGNVVDASRVVTHIDGVKQKSMHNYSPSLAVDIAPWPIDWQAVSRFYVLAGIIMAIGWVVGSTLGFRIRWGGDWDMDWDMKDQRFDDLGHFEVLELKRGEEDES